MDDFEEEQEVEVFIEPREDVLMQHGISVEAFEDALGEAIDAYHEKIDSLGDDDDDDGPSIGEMPLNIAGREFRLDELAEIHLSDESE